MPEMTPEEAAAFEKKYAPKRPAPAAPPPPVQMEKQSVFSRILRDAGQQPTVTQRREISGGSNY